MFVGGYELSGKKKKKKKKQKAVDKQTLPRRGLPLRWPLTSVLSFHPDTGAA
ncbi:hypothetical protein TRV_04573 [Trichophyton verrucosum HKI 0517]|uniref:Uncharacterized protein n=1 Tax=Trichophyton verrucosum (strain HKI 0517) TaxID=663202 RepID=D4DBR3_TRIVH|nr:uncharacterized protein TRV_04573 [Trichophyton verrucosum HKI 0517]EFE40711.1 hypothetical protein TRV_04573 [Trichophyton verrucosum HKI 0517]